MRRLRLLLPLLALFALVALPSVRPAHADGAWLDAPLRNWNAPGMDVPVKQDAGSAPANPRCGSSARPPETDEDVAVADAGWMLVGTYEAGWGVKVIVGTADYDGMCRPAGYQGFVFADGQFAGTVAPAPMLSRDDGSLVRAIISSGGAGVSATFNRYRSSDPLCCPTRTSLVTYRLDASSGAPVLVPMQVMTTPNGG